MLLDITPPGAAAPAIKAGIGRAPAMFFLGLSDTLRLSSGLADGKGHLFGHSRAVFIAQVPIGLCYQQAAILMTKPAGNRLEVYTGLNGIATEEMPHVMMREMREPGIPAGAFHCLFRALNGKYPVRSGWLLRE